MTGERSSSPDPAGQANCCYQKFRLTPFHGATQSPPSDTPRLLMQSVDSSGHSGRGCTCLTHQWQKGCSR